MSELILNLQAAENWQLAYNETVVAGQFSGGYFPIRPFDLPTLFESPILLVQAEYLDAKPWWFLGCRLYQLVNTGVSTGAATGRFARVPVNRPALVRFPRYAAQYGLRVEVPPWFDRLKLSVFEYVGTLTDSTEALIQEQSDLIRVDLVRIETKLNNL